MLKRYWSVYWINILLIVVILALIIISSVTRGKIAKVTSIAAGIVMLYVAFKFILWIVKTPAKKDRDATV
jgi:phage-related holin